MLSLSEIRKYGCHYRELKQIVLCWIHHFSSWSPQAVRMLLDYVDKCRVYQALLSAINLGNEEIAEIIIEHKKYDEISKDLKQHGRAFFSQHKLHDDNQFSDEITPLILAAQQNRFEVVMALLLKGETIEKPHKCHCTCQECVACTLRDELKFARWRLNAYKALASEAYISLSSEDPILTSFELRKTLQQVAKEEKYYTVSSYVLMEQGSAIIFLDVCNSSQNAW